MEDAIKASNSTDTITLTTNVSLDKTLEINKTVNINLNNNTIEADEKVFLIHGGSLNLSGTGKIVETKPNYGAIMLLGSNNSDKKDFSTVNVGKDITLEGWTGIFINHNNKTGYGITVNMNGSINAVDDVNGGTGIGIYVNGYIKNKDNSPVINLSETAKITSTGNGIYSPGYATYNINGAYIEGKESGLGIKSGVFNILNGTIIGSGEDKTPTNGNNNDINASGTAIQIESNANYKGDIKLNIKNGNFISKHSNVIYEYVVNNTSTKVESINIDDGKFTSETDKNVFSFSDSFKNTHSKFISGGIYSSDPSSYLKTGYNVTKNNELYSVVNGSSIEIFKERNNNFNIFTWIIIIFIILLFFFLLKNKIFTKNNKAIKKY